VGAGAPVGALGPDFVLPDRSGFLERVDRESSRLERLGSMRGRHHGDDRGLADLESTQSVQEHHATGVGPAAPQLGSDLGESRHRLLLVGLVREVFDARAPFGVIANRPAEEHDGPALRPNRPVVRCSDRQFGLSETEPVVTIEGLIHVGIVATPPPRPSGRGHHLHEALYDLVLVEPGPLPPHERSWRHPSELGPTRLDVDDAGRRSQLNLLALGGGTLAVLAVAAMVVAMTPRTASGPVALSATTTPIAVRAVVEPPSAAGSVSPTSVRTTISAQTALSTSFVAFPHAVTPGPQLDVDGTEVADAAPADDDIVFLRTEAVTYQLTWDLAQHMTVPDGTVVFDADGALVARVSDGDLVSLVGG